MNEILTEKKQKHIRKDYVEEILRFCRSLTQLKYNSKDDEMYKRLIDENLRAIGRIDQEKTMAKELEGKRRRRKPGGANGRNQV